MYIQSELTLWRRFVEWCFPWRKHEREKAERLPQSWLRKNDEAERGGLR